MAAAGFKEVVVANSRLFEEIEELEEDLVERWVQLLDQTLTIRELTNYHSGGPRRHDLKYYSPD